MYLALNKEDAERIITHDEIYPDVSDDGSAEPSEFRILNGVTALVVYDPEPVACSILYPRNICTYEIHTQTLPEGRRRSFEYGKAMLGWVWANMPVDKLVATIPEYNRKALLYTLRLGFSIEGICPKSFMKNGKLTDQTHIGIERKR